MVSNIPRYDKQIHFCLSTDDPTAVDWQNGDLVFVMDQDWLGVYDADNSVFKEISLGGGGGGDPDENLTKFLTNQLTSYINNSLTTVVDGAFSNRTNLTELQLHGLTRNVSQLTYKTGVVKFAYPSRIGNTASYAFDQSPKLEVLDLGPGVTGLSVHATSNCPKLHVLILRKSSIVSLQAGDLGSTAFKNGGAGGDIYIPKSLYDHLGDGSASDYKNATNWSTYDGYGTITWHAIEGSYYETHYGDDTPIN